VDELWQRYRSFWTPVLIGFGIFLVGLIAVHIASDNPDVAKAQLAKEQNKARNLKQPDPQKARILKERGEALRTQTADWALRLDPSGGVAGTELELAVDAALRAAILRGADDAEAGNPERLKERFDDDATAADKAYKRFQRVRDANVEALRTGDPNVAGSQLLSDVWNELRIRANRANVEIGPAALQLGFGSIASVSRATLSARVLNLALVARIVDTAIRNDVERIDQINVPTTVEAGSPQDFLLLWPVDVVMVGDMAAVKQVIDMLTDPAHPIPLESARLMQPKKSTGRRGLVQFSVKAASAIVRPDANLNLDQGEDQ
jgi:hypothetical protein